MLRHLENLCGRVETFLGNGKCPLDPFWWSSEVEVIPCSNPKHLSATSRMPPLFSRCPGENELFPKRVRQRLSDRQKCSKKSHWCLQASKIRVLRTGFFWQSTRGSWKLASGQTKRRRGFAVKHKINLKDKIGGFQLWGPSELKSVFSLRQDHLFPQTLCATFARAARAASRGDGVTSPFDLDKARGPLAPGSARQRSTKRLKDNSHESANRTGEKQSSR